MKPGYYKEHVHALKSKNNGNTFLLQLKGVYHKPGEI